jgi:hypothetical protein
MNQRDGEKSIAGAGGHCDHAFNESSFDGEDAIALVRTQTADRPRDGAT